MEFLEKKAKEDPDWEEHVPYKAGEKRGELKDERENKNVC